MANLVERTILPYKSKPGASFSNRHVSLMIKHAADDITVDELQKNTDKLAQIVSNLSPACIDRDKIAQIAKDESFSAIGLTVGDYNRLSGPKAVRVVVDRLAETPVPLIYVIYMTPKTGVALD